MGVNMRIGIYPGSFDPVTFGHLDIILRSSQLVDTLIIGVLKIVTRYLYLLQKNGLNY